MRKITAKKGFTLAEMLLVVAIIVVLAAVAFISYISYLRNITKTEYDNYARTIFVAAQNHLTMAEHEGYLGRTGFGEKDDEDGVYYFVVKNGSGYADKTSVLGLILPFGSVDETIRGGNYIIRYHKDTAQVLDVFYWSTSGRFKYTADPPAYKDFLSDTSRSALIDYGSAVIGYHGGVTADGLTKGEELKAPSVVVTNADRLTVTVNNPNTSGTVKLYIKGVDSKAVKEVPLDTNNQAILDDITDPGLSFYKQFCETGDKLFTPGEDIIVYAVAFDDAGGSNVAFSVEQKTNSLYADGTTATEAKISSIRHLENLDPKVSGIQAGKITSAKQSSDLSWTDFKEAINAGSPDSVSIYALDSGSNALKPTKAGCYYPVDVANTLAYDGQNHSISDVKVDVTGAAGLFGSFAAGSVQNLKLIDFTVSGENAGALIGSMTAGTMTNVLAVNSKEKDSSFKAATPNITGTASAGGLIGSMTGGTVEKSAAAQYVKGATAGGLIGTAEGGSVTASYAGGHTTGGMYDDSNYNVVATGSAGGLIGSSKANITNSYSTCSASGATAGGLIGTAADGKSTNCYCTGLVNGTTAGTFAGTRGSATAEKCGYFGIINGQRTALGSGDFAGVTAFDATTADYIAFAGQDIATDTNTDTTTDGRKNASPYDGALVGYYQGKYSLKTVKQLGASVDDTDFVAEHYGDWPSVEIFFVNQKS